MEVALSSGIEQGAIRRDLDVVSTAIILWSSVIGIFNTLYRKRNYIMNYHKRDSDKLILNGFDLLIKSIENGGSSR